MDKVDYYNPSKILKMKDLNKEEPAIYIISTNRSAGKTTAMLKLALENFKERKEQLILIYRYQYETTACCDIFDDVLQLYPELGKEMKIVSVVRGVIVQMFLDGEPFGYSICIGNPDLLKKYSPLFSKCTMAIFDEFQPESGKYLPQEVKKLQSALFSVMRGGGKQSRYIKLFMLSNMVSIMNPYYIEFGIYKRLKSDTKFMRGNGWVAEFGFNESASKAIKDNPVAKAFSHSDYVTYSTEKEYLHTTDAFIEKISGNGKYILTITHDGKQYGVREYAEQGILHISKKYDKNYPYNATFKASDHNQNTIMLSRYSYLWKNIKNAFNGGYLRFDDLETKNAIFEILAIDLYS